MEVWQPKIRMEEGRLYIDGDEAGTVAEWEYGGELKADGLIHRDLIVRLKPAPV